MLSHSNWLPALLLLWAACQAGEPRPVDEPLLSSIRAELRGQHPSLAAARERLQAALQQRKAVRQWEDPSVGISAFAASRGMRDDNGDLGLGIEQMLPRRGLSRAMARKADEELQASREAERLARADLEKSAALALVDLALADEVVRLRESQAGWMRRMSGIASESAKGPAAGALEALKMESELAMEEQRLASARRDRQHLAWQLNILLGRPLKGEWEALALPPDTPNAPDLGDLLQRLDESNPALGRLRHETTAAGAEVEVQHRSRGPAWGVGLDTRMDSSGPHRETAFSLRLSLPWLQGGIYKAQERRARHEHAALQQDVLAGRRGLESEAVMLHTQAEEAARMAQALKEQVIPRSAKAAGATEAAWLSSRSSLLDVLDARRRLLDSQLELQRSVAEQLKAHASLSALAPPRVMP